jgi:nucleotide-binding universal stress UspA family protein
MLHVSTHHVIDGPAGHDGRTIGAAYVDTEEGREALQAAYALADRAGAALRVLAVVKGDVGMYAAIEPDLPAEPGKSLGDVEGEHLLRIERDVRVLVAALGGDVPVDIDTFVGDPADTLIEVSRNLDALVCGSRGNGAVRSALLGSVSRRVTAEAHCPVIVLPRGVKASRDGFMAEPEAPRFTTPA